MDGAPKFAADAIVTQQARSTTDELQRLAEDEIDVARAVLAGSCERSLAQRNAILAFSVIVVGAAVLNFMQIVLARRTEDFEYGIYVFV